ncbi:S1 family peptidase [Skermania piniformis]|uniref:S1 family peptidase n=2 Tax=Skermania pinensis TaxID=39122 RepID=A0ABX8SDN4_9ACTN|nr:S1 family peptidase [Skermania piniformis]
MLTLPVPASADPLPGPAGDLTQAIHRDLGIDLTAYQRRADDAQRLAGFAAGFAADHPATFAGAWLDPDGRTVVGLAGGADRAAARAAVEAAGFTPRDVAKSAATLNAEQQQLDRWLAGLPPQLAALVRGIAVDIAHNALAVRVERVADGLTFPSFVDPRQILVMPGPRTTEPVPAPKSDAITGVLPGNALGGGDAFAAIDGRAMLRCSLGFNGTDAAGQVVNVTAGHCNPDARSAGTGTAANIFELGRFDSIGPKLGTFEASRLDGHDYSLVRVDPGAAGRFANNLVRAPGVAPLAVDGVATPVVGAPVCKSGARTGFSCGTISAVGQTVRVGNRQLTDNFSSSICALPGDSGGAVVSGTKAIGISSASSVADYPFCELPDVLGAALGKGPELFVTPIDAVLADNPGLTLRTS